MSDEPFWINDISVLYKNGNITKIIPTSNMSVNEKYNALSRLSILSVVTLTLLDSKDIYIAMFILLLFMVILLGVAGNNNEVDTIKEINEENVDDDINEIDTLDETVDDELDNIDTIEVNTDTIDEPGTIDKLNYLGELSNLEMYTDNELNPGQDAYGPLAFESAYARDYLTEDLADNDTTFPRNYLNEDVLDYTDDEKFKYDHESTMTGDMFTDDIYRIAELSKSEGKDDDPEMEEFKRNMFMDVDKLVGLTHQDISKFAKPDYNNYDRTGDLAKGLFRPYRGSDLL